MIECSTRIVFKDNTDIKIILKFKRVNSVIRFIKKTTRNIRKREYIVVGNENEAWTMRSSEIDYISWDYE